MTNIGYQDVHPRHETRTIKNIEIGTEDLVEDSPFVDRNSGWKMMNTKEYGDGQEDKESHDTPASPLRPLYHQEALVEHHTEHHTLLPSIKGGGTRTRRNGNNDMKTTFQEGMMEEQTPPIPSDIQEHHVGVRNILENRDEIRGGASGYQNLENSRSPPPPLKVGKTTIS